MFTCVRVYVSNVYVYNFLDEIWIFLSSEPEFEYCGDCNVSARQQVLFLPRSSFHENKNRETDTEQIRIKK